MKPGVHGVLTYWTPGFMSCFRPSDQGHGDPGRSPLAPLAPLVPVRPAGPSTLRWPALLVGPGRQALPSPGTAGSAKHGWRCISRSGTSPPRSLGNPGPEWPSGLDAPASACRALGLGSYRSCRRAGRVRRRRLDFVTNLCPVTYAASGVRIRHLARQDEGARMDNRPVNGVWRDWRRGRLRRDRKLVRFISGPPWRPAGRYRAAYVLSHAV